MVYVKVLRYWCFVRSESNVSACYSLDRLARDLLSTTHSSVIGTVSLLHLFLSTCSPLFAVFLLPVEGKISILEKGIQQDAGPPPGK